LGGHRWRCPTCCRRFTARSPSAFSNHGFPDDVIALAVRWYVRYRVSYADVVEWLAERALTVDRPPIYRWVQRFLPLFQQAARAQRCPVGVQWRVDETYCRLNGTWTYLSRAIDADGPVVDAYVSERRNAHAAEAFFRRAIDETGVILERVTTDRATCDPPALRRVLPHAQHRTSKYLNNSMERDHQHVKQRRSPMRGFKQAGSADILARGHPFIQNLRTGFSALTAGIPRLMRLVIAWPQLAQALSAALRRCLSLNGHADVK
jgi:transposase-like protein